MKKPDISPEDGTFFITIPLFLIFIITLAYGAYKYTKAINEKWDKIELKTTES